MAAPPTTWDPVPALCAELGLARERVAAAVRLLAEGNTVPFIARYRKEATGSLDEVELRMIQERRDYLTELEERRRVVLASIDEQGGLTDELRIRVEACSTKAALEDLYLPFRPRRRTRAAIARERGLLPLAERILAQPPGGDPAAEAAAFVDRDAGVPDPAAALAGARDIVAERAAEDALFRARARERLAAAGLLRARVVKGQEAAGARFRDYFDHAEPASRVPSHRFLAMRRGEREGVLRLCLEVDGAPLIARMLADLRHRPGSPYGEQLEQAVHDAWRRLLAPAMENDVGLELKARADREAVAVFAANLRDLLLAPPLGGVPVIGVDPGLRTGCKCAALDATGRFAGSITFHLVQGEAAAERGRREFLDLVRRHGPRAVAVGNGTGGREADRFVRDALRQGGPEGVLVVQVNEAGASVYSASPLAGEELPDLDVTVRGAVSIGRRLQDPLAELVKIDPQAIGVGQYQHDVHQQLLARKLDEVVESCVSGVGVDLATASAPLLARVAGIGPKAAKAITLHRELSGGFRRRADVLKVKGVGPKAFEQAAGFLRLRGGAHPLDGSAVHPERYGLAERIAADLGVPLGELVGNAALAGRIDLARYAGDGAGEPTLRDMIAELEKPGRDPRRDFEAPAFREDVRSIEDLAEGMELEGVVTNVTAFGAFVDVGVHRDGLVHVSRLADRFVRDPSEVVRVGDRLAVRVLEVDRDRGRISLAARGAR
jgi:uncharacterized protein